MAWQRASVFVMSLGLGVGCAAHLRSIDQGGGFSTGVLFWPAPESTSRWIGEPVARERLGDAAATVEGALRDAGYADERWLRIGARYEHGFAVLTRIERLGEAAGQSTPAERWLSQYPEAATLRWLLGATAAETYLPRRGRYRVLFVAFTDLPAAPVPGRPQRFDETTAMDAPGGLTPFEFPARARIPPGYRAIVGVYEFEAKSASGEGKFVWHDAKDPAPALVDRSLSRLSRIGSAAGD